MMRKKRMWAAVNIFILCLSLCACTGSRDRDLVLVGRQDSQEISGGVTISPSPVGSSESSAQRDQHMIIYVHVCGAVADPGVYALEEGSRGADALQAAGGFSQDADRNYVNLAKTVSDGEKLYFPSQEEARKMASGEGGMADGAGEEGLVDINRADRAALCTLPGIGASRAEDIIAYREAHGGFKTCEDIMKVSGIKNSVYDKIKDKITVN